MTAIGPGDPLLCQDDTMLGPHQGVIQAGTVYTCAEIIDIPVDLRDHWSNQGICARDGCGQTYITLVGVSARPGRRSNYCFCPNRFLPLKPADPIEVATKEKVPCPELI